MQSPWAASIGELKSTARGASQTLSSTATARENRRRFERASIADPPAGGADARQPPPMGHHDAARDAVPSRRRVRDGESHAPASEAAPPPPAPAAQATGAVVARPVAARLAHEPDAG